MAVATKPVKITTIAQLKRAEAKFPGRFWSNGWTIARDYPCWQDRPAGEYAYLIVNDAYLQVTMHVPAVPENHPEYPV